MVVYLHALSAVFYCLIIKELLLSATCANVPRKSVLNETGMVQDDGSESYRYSILLRSGILYWHICDSNTLIQPNESVLYNAEIEFVKIESGYITD